MYGQDIVHSGDATKGSIAENGEGIDEIITVDLKKLHSADVEVVAFCMFVFKGGDFEHINHVYTHGQELTDGVGKQVCRFSFAPSDEDMKKFGTILALSLLLGGIGFTTGHNFTNSSSSVDTVEEVRN